VQGQKEKKGEKPLKEVPLEYFTTCATDPEFISKNMVSVFKSIKKYVDALLAGKI
jgi:hypothetical protein